MRKLVVTYVVIGSLLVTVGAHAGSQWEPISDGFDAAVLDLVVWNGQLIATGWFTEAGGIPSRGIAAWDGSQWMPLGEGLYPGGYNDVTIHAGLLTVDALLSDGNTSGILTWDGATWTRIAPALFDADGYGNTLASFEGTLYAGDSHYSLTTNSYWGRLWLLGGSGWEHEEWFEASSSFGGLNIVTALDDKLYVHVYSLSAPLHVYDGASWSQHSTTHLVHASDLVFVNGELYLGGVDWVGDSYVLRWDGNSWSSITDSLGFSYGDMVEFESMPALGAVLGGYPNNGVVVWDGGTWTRLPGVMNQQVGALAVYDGDLVAAGTFTEVDGIPMSYIARYIGTPTPAAISRFEALRQRGGVRLEWEITADEAFEGFHVYRRSGDGPEVRVNSDVLPVDTRSFVDAGVVPGASYSYFIVAVGAGSGEVRSQRVSVHIPALAAVLEQNVPNPFNPSTTIGFTVPEHSDVRIDVFDGSGARVVTLVDAPYPPGEWTVDWDGTGASGSRVASGVYYYRMRMGNESFSKKMVLLK